MRRMGGCAMRARRAADTNSAAARRPSHRLTRRAVRSGWGAEPVFAVLRNTPSRRAIPSTQAIAVTQLADQLITRASSDLRREIEVQCRSVHIMQMVAMMMRDR